jgi:hypothetical protein
VIFGLHESVNPRLRDLSLGQYGRHDENAQCLQFGFRFGS